MSAADNRKIIFSGIQPTGVPHLGNYLGALKNWVELQAEYNCVYCIVDLHSITVRQDPQKLRNESRSMLAMCIALGIDPERSTLYFQSHVSGHAELAWLLGCYTYMGELSRMVQYKEKSQKHAENINSGLFTYPVLQAADILLFQANAVPVGEDQRQHIELCRDIAIRFNNIYGDVFTVPEALIGDVGCRVMSLQNPENKMSKSDGEAGVILLTDTPDVIRGKFKRAVTDSDNEIRSDISKPGISNLLEIYSVATGKTVTEAEAEFSGVGYGDFKLAVADSVIALLAPFQQRYKELMTDKSRIDGIIRDNAERARRASGKTLAKVYRKIGFADRIY